jgi:hypothetical protein
MISLVVDLAPIENPKPVVSDVEPLLYDFLRPHHHNRGNRQAKSLGGLELIINSNLVGCSTGMSAGFVPLRILSTIDAIRR